MMTVSKSALLLLSLGLVSLSYYSLQTLTPENLQQGDVVSFSSTWRIENISSGHGVSPTSIGIDSDESPWVSYYPPYVLRLAHRENGNWTGKLVDTSNFGGALQSMAIGSNNNIHIVYLDSNPTSFAYTQFDGNAWLREDIEYGIVPEPSLRIDSNGNPHVAYLSHPISGMYPRLVKYASRLNGSWSIEIIADSGPIGLLWGPRVSLALDSENSPHISYFDGYENVLKYTYRSNGSWTHVTVDDEGLVGWYNSIALDSKDNPHVSYFDRTNFEVKYASWNGSEWATQVVDHLGGVGGYTSLALDSEDVPSIVYLNMSGPSWSETVMYASREGGTWHAEIVDMPGYDPAWPSLDLDSCGNPHTSYYVFVIQDGRLVGETRYATKGDPCLPQPEEEPSITLDINPNTLNLKSKGRWITARLIAENASTYDIDIFSILLQDALAPERYDYQDDVLMLKFNRQEFKDTVAVGESVEVKITGKLEDGSEFEAYDYIRVISPGKR